MSPSFAARVLMALVRGYQLLLSPFLGGHCRFEPSCSRYALACLRDHGAGRGSLLSMLRLCKCHPFHPGGHDPPPLPPPTSRALSAAHRTPTQSRTAPKPLPQPEPDLRTSSLS